MPSWNGDSAFTGREPHTSHRNPMKIFNAIAAAAIFGSGMMIVNTKPASAGWFTNCSEIRGGFSRSSKRMVCDGDFGDRVLVECDSLGSSCIKLCTIGGIMDGSR